MSVHPTRPNKIYAGAESIALYCSEDGDDNWPRIPQEISPDHCEGEGFDSRIIRITFDPSWPDDIYVALEVSDIFCSTDDGKILNDMSASLFELAEQPNLQSNIGGRHCGHYECMLDSHALAISSAAPGSAFFALRMALFRSGNGGVWYDTNIDKFCY